MKNNFSGLDHITIDRQNFSSTDEFQNTVKEFIFLLMNNDYELIVRSEEELVIIEFQYNRDLNYGTPEARWIEPEVFEQLVLYNGRL